MVYGVQQAQIEFTCSNPSHTNVKLVLSLKYHDGTEGTIEVSKPTDKGRNIMKM